MTINIIKFDNRKLYVRAIDNTPLKGTVAEKYLGRYINGTELKKLIADFGIRIKVTHKKTNDDVTKEVLVQLLKADLFTLEDLYDLVQQQALRQSVLNKYESENAFYRNGIEL